MQILQTGGGITSLLFLFSSFCIFIAYLFVQNTTLQVFEYKLLSEDRERKEKERNRNSHSRRWWHTNRGNTVTVREIYLESTGCWGGFPKFLDLLFLVRA